MKKILLFLLLLCAVFPIHAQITTEAEALSLADKLYEIEILSQRGRDTLRGAIIHPGEDIEQGFLHSETGGEKGLTKSYILYFLTQAFASDLNYRSGMTTLAQALRAETQDGGMDTHFQERYAKLSDSLQQQWRLTDVWKNEAQLKNEDPVMDGQYKDYWIGSFSYNPMNMPQLGNYDYIHKHRSVTGKQLSRTLTDILRVHLIDSTIYTLLLPEIKKQKLQVEAQVLMAATERVLFYENFDYLKAKEMALIDALEQAGVLSAMGKKQLLASYKEKEIKSKFEYARYANRAKVFTVAQLNRDPVKVYKQVIDSIAMLVQGLKMSNIKFSLHKTYAADKELTEIIATITFNANDQQYKHTFFYNYVLHPSDPEYVEDTVMHISHEFHKGINKWLADQESPLRLYYVNTGDERSAYGNEEFGLILMNKEQAEAWGADGYFLSPENHDNTFNTKNIAKAIKLYEETGLFNHLSKKEIAQGREKAAEQDIDSRQSLLACFPKTLVVFDWETANLSTPYLEHTRELEAASRGAFTISNIQDDFENSFAQNKESTLYSFTLNGKTYSKPLEMKGDWLDPAFLELIGQALQENKVKGKFYYALSDGQVSGYIFLTPEQYDILRQAQPGLFPSE